MTTAKLRQLAELLDDDAVYDFVADTIAEARDAGQRPRNEEGEPTDRDTGECLDRLIEVIRAGVPR